MEPDHLWDMAVHLWLVLYDIMHPIERHVRLILVRATRPADVGGFHWENGVCTSAQPEISPVLVVFQVSRPEGASRRG